MIPSIVLVQYINGIVLGAFSNMSGALEGIKKRYIFASMKVDEVGKDTYTITGITPSDFIEEKLVFKVTYLEVDKELK